MGRPKRWDEQHKEENQGEQSKLVQGDCEPSLGREEVLNTDFKGEPASFCRKNKVPTKLGVQLKTLTIQLCKDTAFYIMYAVTDGRA